MNGFLIFLRKKIDLPLKSEFFYFNKRNEYLRHMSYTRILLNNILYW
jgi:hypothetical protein